MFQPSRKTLTFWSGVCLATLTAVGPLPAQETPPAVQQAGLTPPAKSKLPDAAPSALPATISVAEPARPRIFPVDQAVIGNTTRRTAPKTYCLPTAPVAGHNVAAGKKCYPCPCPPCLPPCPEPVSGAPE